MNLLLIMPNFFNYPEIIVNGLSNLGYHVDYFDDRPSTNAWIKAAIRINKNLVNLYIQRYFNQIMETVRSSEYDVVFLISGQSLSFSETMISEIKESQPKAKFILYQWDSQSNFPYIKKIQKYFDICYSFDREDVNQDPSLVFLPLFYSPMYEEIGNRNLVNFKYDFCFIGTAHPKKYKFIKLMSEQLKHVFPDQFIYFFFPSPIVYIYRKITNREFANARYREFHFSPLKGSEFNEVYENSRCVLDSAQEGQLGLTIRVIEALGARKKLITTNADIINYDFYRPENIYIYKGNIELDDIFFKSDYVDINQAVYEKYSIKNWLLEILGEQDASN